MLNKQAGVAQFRYLINCLCQGLICACINYAILNVIGVGDISQNWVEANRVANFVVVNLFRQKVDIVHPYNSHSGVASLVKNHFPEVPVSIRHGIRQKNANLV